MRYAEHLQQPTCTDHGLPLGCSRGAGAEQDAGKTRIDARVQSGKDVFERRQFRE